MRSTVSVWAQVQQREKEPRQVSVLSSLHGQILRSAADQIIPADGEMPPASDVRVPEYIEVVLSDWEELRHALEAALDWLEKRSRSRYGNFFAELRTEERIATLQELESEQARPFATLRDLVYEGYYTSPDVWPKLKYDFHSTGEPGPSMEAFDERVLAEVRKRPKFYREISDEKRED